MNTHSSVAVGALLSLAACGSSHAEITPQLVDARRVVHQAQMSSTSKLAPRKMDDAWNAFMAAERAHEKDPGSYREAHLAYVAQRKAEAANASAQTLIALRSAHALDQHYQAKLARQASEEPALAAEDAEDAEEELGAAEALEGLEDVADVKQDANTVVITLSSAVLFPTAGDSLSEGARSSLDKVAEAIDAQPDGSHIRVDGYTDARGSETFNEALSKRRAEAVSEYLAQHGVDSAKLTAEGRGESNPIANNDTEDGRASNRRAEIVIELAQRAQNAQPSAAPNDASKRPSNSSAKSAGEPDKAGDSLPMLPVPPEPQPE